MNNIIKDKEAFVSAIEKYMKYESGQNPATGIIDNITNLLKETGLKWKDTLNAGYNGTDRRLSYEVIAIYNELTGRTIVPEKQKVTDFDLDDRFDFNAEECKEIEVKTYSFNRYK